MNRTLSAMKARKAQISVAILLVVLSLLLSACAHAQALSPVVPSFPPLPEKTGLRVAVASDLHFNPDFRPDGDEPLQAMYSLELADALLWDVKRQGADLLLLTGDLCNGGKSHRHEGLIEKLRTAEDNGLPIYVVPGNHDLAPISQTDFASLYDDFGYGEAYSRDPASLSYCVVRDGLMFLMMDTAGYSTGAIDLPGAPGSDSEGPFFSESTLLWAQEMLRRAEELNLHVLAAGHYNLLPEISRDPAGTGYYLENGERFSSLLCASHVPLYLSGHMHMRAVYQQDGLTELLTEYLLAYPTAYSLLDLTGAGITYTPRRIDVNAWAAETGQTDARLLDFAHWQQDGQWQYSVENVDYMAKKNPLNRREKEQAVEFFYRVMDAYWRGELVNEREILLSHPGCAPFFRCAEGYAYGWWLRDLIDTATHLVKGFTIPWT